MILRFSGTDVLVCLNRRVETFLSPEPIRIDSSGHECPLLIDSMTDMNVYPTSHPMLYSKSMASSWLIWQLADSAFQAADSHSAGLEAAWQQGLVSDSESLFAFLALSLRQFERGVLIFVDRSWTSTDQFAEIDADCDLFLNNHVANRASRAQGRALLASASREFSVESITLLAKSVSRRQSSRASRTGLRHSNAIARCRSLHRVESLCIQHAAEPDLRGRSAWDHRSDGRSAGSSPFIKDGRGRAVLRRHR